MWCHNKPPKFWVDVESPLACHYYITNFIKQSIENRQNLSNHDKMYLNKNKEVKDMQYVDITNQYKEQRQYQVKKRKYFIDDDGNKYRVNGRQVILKTTESEMEVAKVLGKTFGGKVNLVPVVLQPKGIQTPDYIINNQKFDLKQIFGNGKNTLDTAINKKKKQSHNFIFDITKTEMKKEQALLQIEKIYNAKNRMWVNMIILLKDNEVLNIFKRK